MRSEKERVQRCLFKQVLGSGCCFGEVLKDIQREVPARLPLHTSDFNFDL